MNVCRQLGSHTYFQQRLNAVLLLCVFIKVNFSQIVINIKRCLVAITSLLVPDFVLSFPMSTTCWGPSVHIAFLGQSLVVNSDSIGGQSVYLNNSFQVPVHSFHLCIKNKAVWVVLYFSKREIRLKVGAVVWTRVYWSVESAVLRSEVMCHNCLTASPCQGMLGSL